MHRAGNHGTEPGVGTPKLSDIILSIQKHQKEATLYIGKERKGVETPSAVPRHSKSTHELDLSTLKGRGKRVILNRQFGEQWVFSKPGSCLTMLGYESILDVESFDEVVSTLEPVEVGVGISHRQVWLHHVEYLIGSVMTDEQKERGGVLVTNQNREFLRAARGEPGGGTKKKKSSKSKSKSKKVKIKLPKKKKHTTKKKGTLPPVRKYELHPSGRKMYSAAPSSSSSGGGTTFTAMPKGYGVVSTGSQPVLRTGHDSIHITHSEEIGAVTTTSTPNTFHVEQLSINPGLSATFPAWLHLEARKWTYFRFTKLSARVITQTVPNDASNLVMCWSYDAQAGPPLSAAKMSGYSDHIRATAWLPEIFLHADPGKMNVMNNWRLVRQSSKATSLLMFDPCTLYYGIIDGSASTDYATLCFDYSIEFKGAVIANDYSTPANVFYSQPELNTAVADGVYTEVKAETIVTCPPGVTVSSDAKTIICGEGNWQADLDVSIGPNGTAGAAGDGWCASAKFVLDGVDKAFQVRDYVQSQVGDVTYAGVPLKYFFNVEKGATKALGAWIRNRLVSGTTQDSTLGRYSSLMVKQIPEGRAATDELLLIEGQNGLDNFYRTPEVYKQFLRDGVPQGRVLKYPPTKPQEEKSQAYPDPPPDFYDDAVSKDLEYLESLSKTERELKDWVLVQDRLTRLKKASDIGPCTRHLFKILDKGYESVSEIEEEDGVAFCLLETKTGHIAHMYLERLGEPPNVVPGFPCVQVTPRNVEVLTRLFGFPQ